MPAYALMLSRYYYAQDYAGIIRKGLTQVHYWNISPYTNASGESEYQRGVLK